VTVRVSLVGCDKEAEIDIADAEIWGLSPEQRDKLLEEYARDELPNLFEWGWRILED
jgi:hypothetical protein